VAFGAAVAVILVFAQLPFAASEFEFQQYHDYAGTVIDWPYPMLVSGPDRILLVDRGKHGASIGALAGKNVQLKGALIHRGADRMLELLPGSLHEAPGAAAAETPVNLGPVTLTGEIVDSKCFLGVMNPGNGKVHRDCAVRCISGGIPPAFLVRDAAGETRTLLLTGSDGRRLNREVLDFVAEPVTIGGELVRISSTFILKAEPASFRRE
jgi:hypothetical protein